MGESNETGKESIFRVYLNVYINSHFRHAGRDPASRRRPDESREPAQRLDPGFHREPWIPAFAGMTILIEAPIYEQTLFNHSNLFFRSKERE